jgi:hypothetical protein
MTTKTEIQATAIYKVTIKETGKECYAVPSDSQPGTYYITCWNEQETRWTCTCEAGKHGRTCKHVRAAQVSVLANKPVATDQKGTLNGSTQGFSLLR